MLYQSLDHLDFDEMRLQYEVNTIGPLRVTRARLAEHRFMVTRSFKYMLLPSESPWLQRAESVLRTAGLTGTFLHQAILAHKKNCLVN